MSQNGTEPYFTPYFTAFYLLFEDITGNSKNVTHYTVAV